MNNPLKILFVSPEVNPFSKTGGLADVSGSLPKALFSLGHDVRVITPLYRCVTRMGQGLARISGKVSLEEFGDRTRFDLHVNETGGVRTYFVEHDFYFRRGGIYGNMLGDYPDNAMRFGFFAKAALAAAKHLSFKPDIIHLNDWQSALVPYYLKFRLRGSVFYRDVKTLFTIHNMSYQGVFNRVFMGFLGVHDSFFTPERLEFYGRVNFMKSAILYSEKINTVSRKYAEEILSSSLGCGLEGLLRTRQADMSGILNGVDYREWSPEHDRHIKSNYSRDAVDNKTLCKTDLIKSIGLDLPADRPLVGWVSRLVPQKGMDLVADVIEEIVKMDAGFVMVGNGPAIKAFRELAKKHPGRVFVEEGFVNDFAHRIEAGADIFVMPSRFEPCGLNQMYSLKYGTIPVVSSTGGLDDVIVDIDADPANGNGFKFSPVDKPSFLAAVKRAFSAYEDKDRWRKLMFQAMSCDFSWEHSAREYIKLYGEILSSPEKPEE
jgi:starch synthase